MIRFVPTPIGNIEDISLRAMRALAEAEVFLCEDTRVTKRLLHLLRERFDFSYDPKAVFFPLHSHNEADFFSRIDDSIFEKNVVYVSDAGMPAISDPGARLVRFAIDRQIPYEVLPGANAALCAFTASGYEETRFIFFGFLPHKGQERRRALLEALSNEYATIVYESPHRLRKLLQEIDAVSPQRELFLAKELTKKFERFFRGDAATLLRTLPQTPKGEWVVVLGPHLRQNAHGAIGVDDIKALDIPKKQKAKLLAKLTGENIKDLYKSLL